MKKNDDEVGTMSPLSVVTGIVVAAIVLGGLMAAFYPMKADAEEAKPILPPVSITVDKVEPAEPAEATRMEKIASMFDGTPPPVVPETPRSCALTVAGETTWALELLVSAAKQIEGCVVTLTPPPTT